MMTDKQIDDAIARIAPMLIEATPQQLAEVAIYLIARASYRASTISKEANVQLLDDVSAFTTTMHIEAREKP